MRKKKKKKKTILFQFIIYNYFLKEEEIKGKKGEKLEIG